MMRICTGCIHPFEKMHLLLNHRRSFRCGGEWNKIVYIPTHRYADDGVSCEMIYTYRPGAKYDPSKPKLDDPTLWRTDDKKIAHLFKRMGRKKRHKGRTPGTVRASRLPGGCSFRNNWEGYHA